MTRRSRFWRCPVCGRRMVPEVDAGTAAAVTPVVATESTTASTETAPAATTTDKEA